ncbi:uncharacterized protein RAG0_13905 [Rhynchosporium agropyri]|uniref:Uncharacterized protein n=1 Tax=Rhynchosporium agropyri TaxID=914238 RepID=A0A1E1LEP9_9HELO|nr:uncharacterized protein RAG0_13905 [Rhynchosporium agropyri]
MILLLLFLFLFLFLSLQALRNQTSTKCAAA